MLRVCSGLFLSLIRSPHGKILNMKVGVRNSIYKFRLETFSFRTSERKIRSAASDSMKLPKCKTAYTFLAKHTEAFHRTVFVHMFEAVFSSIRSPHGKTSNTKVGVCHILYKFRLEIILFRTSERKIRSAVTDGSKLETC